jgi:hypothetical protein
MRQTAIALYILGTLVLVYALFATGTKPDKVAVLVGAIPVLAASVINTSLRRAKPRTYTTTDWLKGTRRRRNPLRSGMGLLAVFFAGVNVLLLDSPYSGARRYFVAAFLLVYVAIIGVDLFEKPDTQFTERTDIENTVLR